MVWVALAVVFIVAIFLVKNPSIWRNKEIYDGAEEESSLLYGNLPLEDLVKKDTDGDGILDWEEGLWGTDPTKIETTSGIPDAAAIAKLKAEQASSTGKASRNSGESEKLTQTDQFSRELFTTIASLSQNGQVDEATIEALSISLAERIKNPAMRKVYSSADIKIVNDNSVRAFTNYSNALASMSEKYKLKYTVLDVLAKFIGDGNEVKTSELKKLDPIIEQTKKMVDAMLKMPVPQSISNLHLEVTNTLQLLVENMSDMKLYDTDAILAISGISKYGESAAKLETDFTNLAKIVDQKLNN